MKWQGIHYVLIYLFIYLFILCYFLTEKSLAIPHGEVPLQKLTHHLIVICPKFELESYPL